MAEIEDTGSLAETQSSVQTSIHTNNPAKMRNEISHERLLALVHYDPLTGQFTWISKASRNTLVGFRAGSVRPDGYRAIRLDTIRYYEHRHAWFYVYEQWPIQHIDHVNMDRVDNRLVNLREASGSQNYGNSGLRVNNSSGFKGVVWHDQRKKWAARICRGGRNFHLGLFRTPEEASAAYETAAKEYFGEFSRLR